MQDLVTRSISGHATERMQHHYSTVRGDEQRESIAKVITLMTPNGRSRVETSEYHLGPKTAPQADPGGTEWYSKWCSGAVEWYPGAESQLGDGA